MNYIAKLTYELAQSEFLTRDDDLSTPEGVIAAAIAIVDRMSSEVRSTWRPVRLLAPLAPAPSKPADAPAPSGGPGGQLVAKPAPAPRAPRPGGAAVRIPAPVAEIVF